MNDDSRGGPLVRLARVAAKIEPHELTAVALSFLLVLVLMTAYSILKPLRDALAADWGNVGLSVTWTVNFGLSLIAVALYGAMLTYVRLRVMVPAIYVFFALTFFVLFIVRTQSPETVLINKGFYIWVSVFSLFNLFFYECLGIFLYVYLEIFAPKAFFLEIKSVTIDRIFLFPCLDFCVRPVLFGVI